ncbi:MAG: hypothetical protein ABJM29_04215 [Rhizobiaceae bacterium]
MSEVELITVEVVNPDAAAVTVEVLGDDGPVIEFETPIDQVSVDVLAGNFGATGPQGPAGPQGPEGPQGPAGSDGVDGTDGVDGAAGAQGPTGPQGPAGNDGADGRDGAAGEDGQGLNPRGDYDVGNTYSRLDLVHHFDGSWTATQDVPLNTLPPEDGSNSNAYWDRSARDGEDGAKGDQGDQGDQGETGPQGPTGPTGPTGPQGPAGADGQNGAPGEDGQDGAPGQDGADGTDGVDGVDGRSFIWRGDYDNTATYLVDDVVSDQDSSWICVQTATGNAPPTLPTEANSYWNLMVTSSDGDGTDVATVQAIAAGSTLGLQQQLLANEGQAAKTVLAVGATNTGKVQGVSLGAGNVVEVYASGADFNAGNALYREFMNFAEPICFTGLANGAIITSSEGFYGVSEQYDGATAYGPMPLLSYGLSFEKTFLFGFRQFHLNAGLIHVVNGPLDNVIQLTFGDGTVVQGQESIALTPWQHITLTGDGDAEYILSGTNRMMACLQSRMDFPAFRDNRLVMPLTNDGITWPRRGFVSALYNNTKVNYYARWGGAGDLNGVTGVSPGAPFDIQDIANLQNYLPDGATRFRAAGLISAFSGADGAGSEATPLMPISAMAQVIAQPFHIGDGTWLGDESGIALASCYECEAKYYEYDEVSGGVVERYHIQLTRNESITLDSPEKQFHPAAAGIANDVSEGVFALDGDLKPGVIVATAPVMMVAQNGDVNLQPTIRSQNDTTTTSIITESDESLMLGWTPDALQAEITTDADGFERLRKVDAAGDEFWALLAEEVPSPSLKSQNNLGDLGNLPAAQDNFGLAYRLIRSVEISEPVRSVDFTELDETLYDSYLFIGHELRAEANTPVEWLISIDGGVNYLEENYFYYTTSQSLSYGWYNVENAQNLGPSTLSETGPWMDTGLRFKLEMLEPHSNGFKSALVHSQYLNDSASLELNTVNLFHEETASINAVRFMPSDLIGNLLAGTIQMYGRVKG